MNFSDSVQKSLNKSLPNCNIEIHPSDEFKRRLLDASEKEIVRASLEATMQKTAGVRTNAYLKLIAYKQSHKNMFLLAFYPGN